MNGPQNPRQPPLCCLAFAVKGMVEKDLILPLLMIGSGQSTMHHMISRSQSDEMDSP